MSAFSETAINCAGCNYKNDSILIKGLISFVLSFGLMVTPCILANLVVYNFYSRQDLGYVVR